MNMRPMTSHLRTPHCAFCFTGATAFGIECELLSYPEVVAVSFGNMKLVPCLDTLHALPWVTPEKHRVGEILCETRWMDGNPQEMCPRFMARKQLETMRDHGYTLTSAFEFEFMLTDAEGKQTLFSENNIFSHYKFAPYEPLMYEIDSFLTGSGVDVESYMIEYAPGQFELATNPASGIRTPDMGFILKEALKEICVQKHQRAAFMTKPSPTQIANGLHFNHSVFNLAGRNLFYDAESDSNLSDIARCWLAGLVAHAGALAAICSPTVNCYRRLHQPWAPDIANWAIGDRMTCFRVKAKNEKRTYIENRIPGGSANPYLVVAATVAAGMDGIKRKLKCPDEREDGAKRLPDTLSQALQELQDDVIMVEALGEQFVRWFVKMKTEGELEKLKDVDITKMDVEKERQLYFEML